LCPLFARGSLQTNGIVFIRRALPSNYQEKERKKKKKRGGSKRQKERETEKEREKEENAHELQCNLLQRMTNKAKSATVR